jgi:hypothetical protein
MFSTRHMRKIKLKSLLFGLCESSATIVFALPIGARVQLIRLSGFGFDVPTKDPPQPW